MAAGRKVFERSKLRRLKTLTQWRRSQSRLGEQEPSLAEAAAEAPPAKRPRLEAAAGAAARAKEAARAASAAEAPAEEPSAEEASAEATQASAREPSARAREASAKEAKEASVKEPSARAKAKEAKAAAPRPKLEAGTEIRRILAADEGCPEEVLGLDSYGEHLSEEVVTSAWKRLVLLLHPDKLQRLPDKEREDGAEALHRVHQAKDELRQRSQAVCAQVPAAPEAGKPPKCLEHGQGKRKYEISWTIPESQDPGRPVENYEIWGPMYFSEAGEPYQWTLLATVPSLQPQFVLVEEAPTQQDVMWACDRVLRPTLPICVHAVNGKGQSEPLTFELPWATTFPWLCGTPSVFCSQCFRLSACTGAWTKCTGCGANVTSEQRIVVRCPECQGEVLWAQHTNVMRCTCCLRVLAKDQGQQWRPGTKPLHGPPQMKQQQYHGAPQRVPPRPPTQHYARAGAAHRQRAW